MDNRKNVQTYIPGRNKELPGKRYSRRTTTVRPITFFKNWDSSIASPSGSKSPQVNTQDDSEEQEYGSHDEHYVPETQQTEEVHEEKRETSVAQVLEETPQPVAQSPKDPSLHRSKTDKRKQTPTKDKSLVKGKREAKVQNESRSEEEEENNETGGDNKLSDKEVDEAESDSRRTRNKSKTVNIKKNITEGENQSVVEESTDETNEDDNEVTASKTETANDKNHRDESIARSKRSNVSVHGKTKAGTDQSKRRLSKRKEPLQIKFGALDKLSQYLEQAGLSVSTPNSSPAASPLEKFDKRAEHSYQQKSSKGIVNPKDIVDYLDDIESNGRKTSEDENEEIDITHRIPLAQSTAIGIEIEQDFDEEEDQNESDNLGEASPQKQDTGVEHNNTEAKQLKRKLTTSTPVKIPSVSMKKRKISITERVQIEQVVNIANVDRSDIAQQNENARENNTTHTSKRAVPGSGEDPSTPANILRDKIKQNLKKVGVSSTETPKVATPSYVITSAVKSGPVARPQKKRTDRGAAPQEVISSPQRIEEIGLWQGDDEKRRKVTDTTYLDVVLQTFEEVAWHFKESIEIPPVRKAVSLCARKVQNDLHKEIEAAQQLKRKSLSFTRLQTAINRKRMSVLALQKEYTSKKGMLAKLKLEHDEALARSERSADVRKFKDAMKKAIAEQKKEKSKDQSDKQTIIVTKLDDYKNIPPECVDQVEKLTSRHLTILRHQCSS